MSNLNQNQDIQNNVELEEDTPIDWEKYIGLFLQNWKKIFIVACVFGIIGIGVALMQKRTYRVSITLAPEVQGSNRSGSSLSSIASMFGMNMNLGTSTSDALNIMIFPEIVSSTPFLTQLFDVELSPMPALPKSQVEAREMMKGPLPTVKLYDHLTGRDKEKGWFSNLKESIFGAKEEDPNYLDTNVSLLTKEQQKVVEGLRRLIAADVDKKTAVTTLSVTMDDPLMCAQLADTVCSRLQDFVFTYRTEKEQQNFDYYEALCDSAYQKMSEAQAAYAASMDNNHSVIMQSVAIRRERLQQEASMASQIYQQMVQQRELSRARLQELKPVFAVVEPGTFPFKPTKSKRKTVMMFGFFGFFLATAWYVLGKEYYDQYLPKVKEMLKNKKEVTE